MERVDDVGVDQLRAEEWFRFRSIRLRALREDSWAFSSRWEEEEALDEATWRGRLELEDRVTLVARVGAHDVALVSCVASNEPGVAELVSMWVAPPARGQGVGRRLGMAVTAWAQQRGFDEVWLWLFDHNAVADQLYRELGFRRTGRRDSGPPPDQLMMEQLVLQLPARGDRGLEAMVANVVARHTNLPPPQGPGGAGSERAALDLDSLQVVALMLDLEEALHVEFDTQMVGRHTFATVGTICAAIQVHRSREAPQEGPAPDAGSLAP